MITPQNKSTARQNWLFYVACSPQHGGGHMARSITLATQLSQFSHVHFVLERPAAHWHRHLESLGIASSSIEGLDMEISYDGLWVDHYEPDAEALQRFKSQSARSYALIDSPDQNTNYDECFSYTKILNAPNAIYGFEYALIDARYAQPPVKALKNWDIVMSFGQSDTKNTTSKVLKALENYEVALSLGVVCGQSNPHKQSLHNHRQHSKHDITLIENADTLLPILPQAKISLGAGGVSMLEACAAGLACGIVTTANNQNIQTKALSDQNAIIWIGSSDDLNHSAVLNAVEKLMDPAIQAGLSSCGKAIIDGKGSARLANNLLREGF